MVCSLMRRSERSLGRLSPLARTLETWRLVGPNRIKVYLLFRASGAGPLDAYGHPRTKIRNTRPGELRGHVIAVAGGVHRWAHFHDASRKTAFGITDQRKLDRRAMFRAAACGFRDLKLNLKGAELADAEAF